MDAQDTHLAYYESIRKLSQRMLEAARGSDWDALVEAERGCAALIARLRATSALTPLDAAGVGRKRDIIRAILADDAEIRNLTQPWLRQLEVHLGNARLAHRVGAAYRP